MRKETIDKDSAISKMGDLFGPLTDEQRNLLDQNLTIKTYKKNEVIYQEGERPHALFCLVQGKVKIYKSGVGGRNQIIRMISPTQYFGYRAYFAGEKYSSAASAFERSTLVQISLASMVEVIRQNTELAWFFIKSLSSHLGMANERTINLTQKHLQGRLAESILFLKDAYGLEEDGCTLSIYLSREDMANLSNMTTSNAIRTLSGFAADKLIAVDGRKIKIIDLEGLEQISKHG